MNKYIFYNKKIILIEIVMIMICTFSKMMLSIVMGDMTNAAVDMNSKIIINSASLCVFFLIIDYISKVFEVYFRKVITGNSLNKIKSDLYSSLSNSGLKKFHLKNDLYYLNLLEGDVEILENEYFNSIWKAVALIIQVIVCGVALINVSLEIFLYLLLYL